MMKYRPYLHENSISPTVKYRALWHENRVLRMVINYAAHLHEISRMVKYRDPFREKFLWLYGFINGRLEILFMALQRLSITDSRSNVYYSVVRKYFSGVVDGFDEVIYQ